MNTRRAPLLAQSNDSQPPPSDWVGVRPHTSGDNGAAGHGLTHRAMVLTVETAVTAALSGCGLRLGEGSPVSLPSASASETARDGLARQAALVSSTAGVITQAGGRGATTAGLAEGVKQAADAQLETLGEVWQPWPSQVPSAYPTVTPVPSASAGVSAQDLTTALVGGSTLARRAAIAAASEQGARLFTSLTVAWDLRHGLFQPPSSADESQAEVAQGFKISSGLLASYDATHYAMEELAARSGDSQRTRAITGAKVAASVVNAAVATDSRDKWLGAYATPNESTGPGVSTQVLWARQVWSVIVSSEVQEAGSVRTFSPARRTVITDAVNAARRAIAWGADFSSLPGYTA